MFSYIAILRKAYSITIKSPLLWGFGFLVIGGFNLNFFHFQNIPARNFVEQINFAELIKFFQGHPGALASISFSILVFSLVFLLATNWSRVMLALFISKIAKKQELEFSADLRRSRYLLLPVLGVSMLTTSLVVVVGAALIALPLYIQNPQLQTAMWSIAAAIFLPIVFIVSCINIFTVFFIAIFKQPLSKALRLGTDLVISRWTQIIGLVFLLFIIYSFCFFVGLSFITLISAVFRMFLETGEGFHILSNSVIIWVPQALSALALWALLAILNVYINAALLLLFFELVEPVDLEKNQIPVSHQAATVMSRAN